MLQDVTGQFLAPDGSPLSGSVVFTPTFLFARDTQAVTLPAPVTARLDAEGRVAVSLLVPSPDTEPDAWVWEACPQLRGKHGVVRLRDFAFELTADAPVNLAEVAPVPDPVTGEYVTRGEAGKDGVGLEAITLEDGELVFTLTNGAEQRLPAPVGEKGDDGKPGKDGISPPPPTLRVGEVTTLPTGSTATAAITGEAPDYTLALAVPQGAPGAKGDKGDSIIGPAGPKGEPGNPSALVLVGVGRPDVPSTLSPENRAAVADALVGATFTSTDGAGTGAWAWVKNPTGWKVTYGDTGWRNVGVTTGLTADALIRRVNGMVYLAPKADAWKISAGADNSVLALTTGFRSSVRASILLIAGVNVLGRILAKPGAGTLYITTAGDTAYAEACGASYLTSDPWPVVLPGAPA